MNGEDDHGQQDVGPCTCFFAHATYKIWRPTAIVNLTIRLPVDELSTEILHTFVVDVRFPTAIKGVVSLGRVLDQPTQGTDRVGVVFLKFPKCVAKKVYGGGGRQGMII